MILEREGKAPPPLLCRTWGRRCPRAGGGSIPQDHSSLEPPWAQQGHLGGREGSCPSAWGCACWLLACKGREAQAAAAQCSVLLLLGSSRRALGLYCRLYWEILFLLELTQHSFIYFFSCNFTFHLSLLEGDFQNEEDSRAQLLMWGAAHVLYGHVAVKYCCWGWEEEKRELHLPPTCSPPL